MRMPNGHNLQQKWHESVQIATLQQLDRFVREWTTSHLSDALHR